MRSRVSTLWRWSAATGVLVAVGAGVAVGSSMPAAAVTQPLLVGDCHTTVEGSPGQPIALRPSAIVGPVVTTIESIPLVGPTLAGPAGQAITAMAPIPLGVVPAGGGFITGGQIASATTTALGGLPVLAPVATTVLADVQPVLTKACGLTVTIANSTAAPGPNAPGAPAGNPPGQPGAAPPPSPSPTNPGNPGLGGAPAQQPPPGQPAGIGGAGPSGDPQAAGGLPPSDPQLYHAGINGTPNFGRVPLYDYSGLPFATPGQFMPSPGLRYGDGTPGQAPQSGTAAPDGTATLGTALSAGRTQDIGQAQSLEATSATLMGVPMFLAAVTVGLVRSWTRRRAAG